MDAPLGHKHAMIRKVFKYNLTYKNGMFRTPSSNPDVKYNLLLLKQIGLLDVEQPYEFENRFSYCGEWGIYVHRGSSINSAFKRCIVGFIVLIVCHFAPGLTLFCELFFLFKSMKVVMELYKL